jgi:peptide/nickel transport system substrate-binding protein
MVKVGSSLEFQVQVTFQGKPYPTQDIEFVRYLLFDARSELVELGNAESVREGVWRVALNAKQTARLALGSNRLEVAVTSRVVALPSFRSFRFVTMQEEIS